MLFVFWERIFIRNLSTYSVIVYCSILEWLPHFLFNIFHWYSFWPFHVNMHEIFYKVISLTDLWKKELFVILISLFSFYSFFSLSPLSLLGKSTLSTICKTCPAKRYFWSNTLALRTTLFIEILLDPRYVFSWLIDMNTIYILTADIFVLTKLWISFFF